MRARIRLQLPLLGLAPHLAWAAPPLAINFDAASPPTMYAGRQGEAAGIYPAIVRAAFARLGLATELRPLPFKRVLSDLLAGTAAAGAVVRSAERLAVSDYSADYFTEHLTLFHAADRALRFSTLEDLRGLSVGVIRGWSYGADFDAARERQLFRVEEVEGDDKNFAKLRRGRIDAVLATEMGARLLLGAGATDIVAAPRPLISIGIALALPKRLAARALLQRFDEAVLALRREHHIDTLVSAEIERARKLLPGD